MLADLAKGRLRSKIPALREALQGRFDHLHAVWIGAILNHIDFLDEQIASLTSAIGEQIAPFEKAVELLRTIPGVQRRTAECIIAEIGVDMSVFPDAKHLASWAGRLAASAHFAPTTTPPPAQPRDQRLKRLARTPGPAITTPPLDGSGRPLGQVRLPADGPATDRFYIGRWNRSSVGEELVLRPEILS